MLAHGSFLGNLTCGGWGSVSGLCGLFFDLFEFLFKLFTLDLGVLEHLVHEVLKLLCLLCSLFSLVSDVLKEVVSDLLELIALVGLSDLIKLHLFAILDQPLYCFFDALLDLFVPIHPFLFNLVLDGSEWCSWLLKEYWLLKEIAYKVLVVIFEPAN